MTAARLTCIESRIGGLWVVDTAEHLDRRGSFARLFCANELSAILDGRSVVQINHSVTHAVGAVRGLHYQRVPHAEMKLVRCLRGRVWDVVVDLRAESATFLRWEGFELSATNRRMVIVPERCAHGFQILEPDSEVFYLQTAAYTPEAEGAVRYDDPRVAIRWPLAPTVMSDRDLGHALLPEDFRGLNP